MTSEITGLREALERRRSSGPAGVADWRISWTWWRSAEVGVKDAQPANVYSPLSVSEGIAARLLIAWNDGKISSARAGRSEILEPDAMISLARAAGYDDPDAANFSGPQTVADVPLHVPSTAEVTEGRVGPLASLLELAREKADAHGFATYSGSAHAQQRRGGVLTSRGCALEGESTDFSYSFWFEGKAGEGLNRREVIAPEIVAPRLEIACDYVERLGEDERGFDAGSLPILLHPQVAESFLSTYLFTNLSGERIWNRQSAFRIEQFRERALVAGEDLSVRLDPLIPYGPASFRFTTEGMPARATAYLDQGRLVNPILDMKYARRFGMEVVPQPAGIESVMIDAREIAPFESVLADVPRALLVLGVLGLHTQDPASGDFSLSAPQSLAMGRGRLGGRVRAALTGNFLEALRQPELRLVRFRGFHMPGILFTADMGLA